ncbi:uncharacterized protein LOC125762692 isoform X3 [Anopheles funestus]|uniref:uncharacterized protein LOC125762692 isoform X3 n=1 Tax=Anopheles funestus TaxID=62324 RepID=UPI0020C74577|nr:uncharacterized protein LOC125762692 isoform X3 [Anopheles funestus]
MLRIPATMLRRSSRGYCVSKHGTALPKRRISSSSLIDIAPEVRETLRHTPQLVVALESTIITHGMPYPHNLDTALEVEQIVRQQGAVPATIAIVGGRIKVGLAADQLRLLARNDSGTQTLKTSRRDMAYVMATGRNGGTTVAGTLLVADAVGIRIFATGGIGGVHREGERTMDVSADLIELGRCPVAVVSSGVKSILDIPRTLEYLETQGVCVTTYGSEDCEFPAFYTRSSGSKAAYNLTSATVAAKMLHMNRALGLGSGILIGVPIPERYAMDAAEMNAVIAEALGDAERKRIQGKEVTPFILSAVSALTRGKSLDANMGLIKNNAHVAADIAVELARLENGSSEMERKDDTSLAADGAGAPLIIGGSVIDICISVLEDDLKVRCHGGHASQRSHVALFFEPTDMRIAARPFYSDNAKLTILAKRAIKFISPNIHELAQIAQALHYPGSIPTKSMNEYGTVNELLADVRPLGLFVSETIDHVLVTLGHYGVAVFRRTSPTVPFFNSAHQYQPIMDGSGTQGRFYPGRKHAQIVNVSGAGDSFTSGFIAGALAGRSEPVCVNVALEAAGCALQSRGAVADQYFNRTHPCWLNEEGAPFRPLDQ